MPKSEPVCRTCLRGENLAPIFARGEQHERYTLALFLTTGLQITIPVDLLILIERDYSVMIKLDDGLPQTICWECTEFVNSFLLFRRQSHRTEVQLLRLGFRRGQKLKKKKRTIESSVDRNTESQVPNAEPRSKRIKIEVDLEPIGAFVKPGTPSEDRGPAGEFVGAPGEGKLYEAFKRRYSDDDSHMSPGYISDQNHIVKSDVPRRRARQPAGRAAGARERRAALLSLVDGPLDRAGPVRCRLCKKTVSRWASFRTHSKLHLGFDFVCEYCGKSFISITQLRRHCSSKHGEARTVGCSRCSYKALDKRQLVLHERREHTGERPFVCDACGASYFSRRCLIQHIENHGTARTIQCEKCPSMFKSRRHLARHNYTCHTSKAFNYRCHVCRQLYKKLKYVRHHMSKMHGLSTQQQGQIDKIKL